MWPRHTTKKARIEAVRKLLETNDKAVARGLLALYSRQTESERCNNVTLAHNGVGFSARDAYYMSGMAKRLKAGTLRWQCPSVMAALRPKVMHYARQLADLAEAWEAKRYCTPTIEVAQRPDDTVPVPYTVPSPEQRKKLKETVNRIKNTRRSAAQ